VIAPNIRTGVIPNGVETDDEYRHSGALTQSALKDYIFNPFYYYQRHILHEGSVDETTEMRMGTALHCLVLEREAFAARYAIQPAGMRKNTKAYDAWLEGTGGKRILTDGECRTVEKMRDAILGNTEAKDFLDAPGENELTLRMVDPKWGMTIQGRLDAWRPSLAEAGMILDLKTTGNLDKWPRDAAFGGTPIQAEWYAGLAQSMFMLDCEVAVVFIVVEREVPYRVGLFQFAPPWHVRARKEITEAMAELKHSLETNTWQRDERGIKLLHPGNF
jgi:hypothetical protein